MQRTMVLAMKTLVTKKKQTHYRNWPTFTSGEIEVVKSDQEQGQALAGFSTMVEEPMPAWANESVTQVDREPGLEN